MNQPELCVICQRPAAGTLADYPLCAACYNAVTAPDPICFECGEALTEAETPAGETVCGECRGEAPAGEMAEEAEIQASQFSNW